MAELHPSAPTPTQTSPTPAATGGLGLAIGAATIITAITGIAFWLSYHHLHDVAAGNGLGIDPARAWAWPAVLDLFYLAGELLILRASYLRTVDPWAIALTAIGALGSIGLNVAGVGAHASVLEYTVAAVPPVAALLAFGALMRQLHVWFAHRDELPPADAPSTPRQSSVEAEPVTTVVERVSPQQPVPPMPSQAPQQPLPPSSGQQAIAAPAHSWQQTVPPGTHLLPIVPRPTGPAPAATPAPTPIKYSDPRCAVIRALYNTQPPTRPGTKAMREALVRAGYEAPSDGIIRGTLRTEVEAHEPHLAQLPPAPFAIGA
ncbi:DUF2637 domain-containing protein [Streptomyces sp. NPDC006193]|uniref:DUF2637 domain-containing protein n=1 Tax=Streptomyces sp. NPDC006193 TaxID=3155717 RepID=UPI0033A0D9B1